MDTQHLQRRPAVPAMWSEPDMTVELVINVPDRAQVSRNISTGQVMIAGIQIFDLVNLRDSISEQIDKLQGNGWQPF